MAVYSLEGICPVYPASGRYWIADNATVLGNVRLGENTSVWFNAVVRGDNDPIVIGDNSNIQDGSILHTDYGCPLRIGENVTVGHGAVLHGCTIGNETLIGIGATILNRATIGTNCLIGAGSLIPEHKVIPDNSLVMGAPGKVVKTVSPEQIVLIKASAQIYVNNWQRFKASFKPVTT